MTLCVSWNTGTKIHFASDSRISNGITYSDYGIKVIPIPIKIFSPTESETGKISPVFEKTYGMCFEGSFTGAYVMREFLVIALQRLQYVPGWIEVSFLQICQIVKKFYNHLAQEIYHDLNYDHSINFFFAGYCPKEKTVKIARFFIQYGENLESYNPTYEILKKGDFVEAIGSGEEDFRKYLDSMTEKPNLNLKILNAIKQTIDGMEVPSVGGNIQYGNFDNKDDFTTYGIKDYEYDENGLLKAVKHYIAGINMTGDEFEPKNFELHIMGAFIDPFKNSS